MTVLKRFIEKHPLLVAWFVLAVGMVAILLWSARDVPLMPAQRFALAAISVGVAGLCVWIISWE